MKSVRFLPLLSGVLLCIIIASAEDITTGGSATGDVGELVTFTVVSQAAEQQETITATVEQSTRVAGISDGADKSTADHSTIASTVQGAGAGSTVTATAAAGTVRATDAAGTVRATDAPGTVRATDAPGPVAGTDQDATGGEDQTGTDQTGGVVDLETIKIVSTEIDTEKPATTQITSQKQSSQAVPDTTQAVPSDTTQAAPPDTTQAAPSDTTQAVPDTTLAVSSDAMTQAAADTTQAAIDTTQAAADTTRASTPLPAATQTVPTSSVVAVSQASLSASPAVPDTTVRSTPVKSTPKITDSPQKITAPVSVPKSPSTGQTALKSSQGGSTAHPTIVEQVPPSINTDDLTDEQIESTVTVVLAATQKKWEHEGLWEKFVDLIEKLIGKARGRTVRRRRRDANDVSTDVTTDLPTATDTDTSPGTDKSDGDPEVTFVGDSQVKDGNLQVSFFADDGTGELVGSNELAGLIKDNQEDLESELGVRLVSVSEGLPAEKSVAPVKSEDDSESRFNKHAGLFITLIVIACICLVIIIVGLIYIMCGRQRHEGQHYLHPQDAEVGGIDNPAMTEKVNGAQQPILRSAADNTEIVPYDNFTPEELNYDEVEDTHL